MLMIQIKIVAAYPYVSKSVAGVDSLVISDNGDLYLAAKHKAFTPDLKQTWKFILIKRVYSFEEERIDREHPLLLFK